MCVAGVGLCSAKHDGVQTMAVVHHVVRALEQRRIEKADQHPEAEVIALMRRGRQQQKISAMLLQFFAKTEVLRSGHSVSAAVGGQVMSFVKHDQIPQWCFE